MVTLYSNDCPKCKILKFKLDNKNIQYDLCSDIDVMSSKGFQSTPMLEVDGKTMNYLDAINWVKEQ
jgi:glutaredoxin